MLSDRPAPLNIFDATPPPPVAVRRLRRWCPGPIHEAV